MAFWSWSKTSSANATSDATINWAEGQAPSSVNDSSRAMMARTAEYRDDIAGAIVTGGTSTAYTVTSNQVFDTLAHMSGAMIAFSPHTTNAATVTLNVDGLGAKPLRSAPSIELQAGTIIQGTPYLALYNNSDAAWYLHGFYGNPYNIPIGAGVDYWLTTAPNSSFVFPTGQAISRTTYATLFASMSTAFGTGDGSTTFNLPDKRGRASFCIDNMGGVTANRLLAGSMAAGRHTVGTIGAGGADTNTLGLGQIPGGITSSGSNSISVASASTVPQNSTTVLFNTGGVDRGMYWPSGTATITGLSSSGTNAIAVTSNNTSGGAHDNLPPLILCNYIMRII